MKIAVLGCGPSALVATLAFDIEGNHKHDINIFAPGVKSNIYGAQYLHQPIPHVYSGEPHVIRYVLHGRPEDYLQKVYGDVWDGTITDEMRTQAHVAWDLRSAYDSLWSMYGDLVIKTDYFAPGTFDDAQLDEFDMVVNTIPRPALCSGRHQFKGTSIWAAGDTNNGGSPVRGDDWTIHYMGREEPAWYRTSRIFGYSTVEWPGWMDKPPFDGVVKVNKPLAHNCNCFPRIKHLGRMGKWKNGALLHHVYSDAAELLMIAAEES